MSHRALFPDGAASAYVRQLLKRLAKRHQLLLALLAATLPIMIAAGVSGRIDKLSELIAQVAYFGPIVLGMSVMSGIVSDDLRSGTILLWYQQPGDLRHWYLRRYAELQLVLFISFVLLSLAVIAIGVRWTGMSLEKAVNVLQVAVLGGLISAAMVFACSAWGLAKDSMAALLTIFAGIGLALLFAFDDRPLAFFVRALAFPIDSLQIIALDGGAFSVRTAWIIITAHLVGWTLLGVLGLSLLPKRLASKMTGE